ncbi:unnamed protein product [Calypogeia fissa]
MVDFQACAAASLVQQSSCPPSQPEATNKPPEPALSMPQHQHHHNDTNSTYQISDQVVGVGESEGGGGRPLEEDEERGRTGGVSSSLDGGVRRVGGVGSFGGARQALKRSRLAVEEDDQLSISPMDLSGANDYTPPFFHHPYHHHQQQLQQQLYPHHHHHHHYLSPAVEATNRFVNTHHLHSHPQQQVSAEQNGHHGAASAHMEPPQYAVGDAHMMVDVGNHHYHGGLWNPQMPGQMAGQGPAVFQGLNVGEVLAELERERKKNADLQGRLSSLEARLGGGTDVDRHGASVQNGGKKSKKNRRSIERTAGEGENEENRKKSTQPDESSAIKEEDGVVLQVTLPLEDPSQTDCHDTGVTWMSREVVTPAELEKLSKDILSERDDSGDSDDDDEDEEDDEEESEDDKDGEGAKKKRKGEGEQQQLWNGVNSDRVVDLAEDVEKNLPGGTGEKAKVQDGFEGVPKKKRRKSRKERRKGKQGEKALFSKKGFGAELVSFRGPGTMATYKKAPKTAFCPKEVKRIMESGVLALKNAQSHTMRKIIVFASLGIRHGCEDLYELDFSHFSVVRRGEPYKSPKDPGEHVLYDHSGVRTKMFYPNRQNPILCPVRILDEEMAMRPAGPSCPTCLFLCIKYGGRTRNLPQNEYVRQRMGRNKLKSFGPLMCQMALLVHIRTGSFFFKALGITLLFMAGFPDDLVRKETKYRNLDLLQKYYRSDEDAKGEQLFHPYPTFYPPAMMVSPPPSQKTAAAAKGTGKKGPPPLLSKPPFTPTVPRYMPPLATRSPPAMPFQGVPPQFCPPVPSMSLGLPAAAPAAGHPSPAIPPPPPPPPFGMYPPYHPPMHQGGFMPMPWAPVNSYTPGPYPPTPFAFQPFPSHSSQFLPPFYGPPYRFPPYGQESTLKDKKQAEESGDSQSDSDTGSSGAGKKVTEKGTNKEGL